MADKLHDWKDLVLLEMKSLRKEVIEGRKDIAGLKTEMAVLKVKSGIWGFAAGAIPVVGSLLIWILKNQLSA